MITGRILAIDPGEKRIGIAISDPTASIATPLTVIKHVQLDEDCRKIIEIAEENEAVLIVIGQALGGDGEETRQSRHAVKMVESLRSCSSIEVQLWDESNSTIEAKQTQVLTGGRRSKREGHMDDKAAAMILKSFLDAHKEGLIS